MQATAQRIRVLMITEGTYPYSAGGVSNWCDMLIRALPEIDFSLVSIVGDPPLKPVFALPANVCNVQPIALWGVREALEIRPDLSLRDLHRRRSRTTEQVLATRFRPALWSLLAAIFADCMPPDLGLTVQLLHRFFLAYDLDTAMRSAVAWHCFLRAAQRLFPDAAARAGYTHASFTLGDLTEAMLLLYRWLMPLAVPLPHAAVVHTASAGLCSLLAVAAKLEHGMPFLLTEHGIYLRERYLAEADSPSSLFLKLFSLGFVRRVTELSYLVADQISPGSNYNLRWELRNGARPQQLLTIYNGVDPASCRPMEKPGDKPVVVWMGRITPIKDLMTLLRAAALVCEQSPDVEFRLYGSYPKGDEAYYQACLALRAELGLEERVKFSGYAASAEAAFNEADIVVLSSVSEGFPYTVVEAMLCARPVVATAVGGVAEALEGCGLTVEPRNPQAMAGALLSLIEDPARCKQMGQIARKKAETEFTLEQCAVGYRESYSRLAC